jgi:cytochrome b pre-mRNA-processing protein 3
MGKVPDTIDGRFALLATIIALLLVRIEHEGEAGNQLSVAVTERFIAAMEAEHRELGLGDPSLGRTVRKLVGSLSRRVDLWRSAITAGGDWDAATKASLYKCDPGADPGADALDWAAAALRARWSLLSARNLAALESGDLG